MIPVREAAKGIFQIGPLGTNRATAATGPYLVVGNDRAMVLEPGEDGQVPGLIEGIKQCGVDLDRVAYVWASHIHLHHIQGVPELLKRLPRAKFLVHPRGAPHVTDPTRLIESTIQVWGDRCYGPMAPVPADRVMAVTDGQLLALGGRELEIVYAPGHAPHHMGLFDRLTKALFPGDLDTGVGSFGGPGGNPSTIFDVDKHVECIRRYQALNPSMLLTFGRQENFTNAQEMLENIATSLLAISRICEVAMRHNLNIAEIDRRVAQFQEWTEVDYAVGLGTGMRTTRGAPPHIVGHVMRKYKLPLPPGVTAGPSARVRG